MKYDRTADLDYDNMQNNEEISLKGVYICLILFSVLKIKLENILKKSSICS